MSAQRWWQKCRWEVIGTAYEPPGGNMKFGPAEGEAAWRLMQLWDQIVQGFTTITLRCSLCGDVKTRLEPGRAVNVHSTVSDRSLELPHKQGACRD